MSHIKRRAKKEAFFKASDFERSLENTYNEVTKVPICSCGKEMLPVYDMEAGYVTGHLFYCPCLPDKILSIG